MRKKPVIRTLCILLAVLVVAATGASIVLRLTYEPASAEVAPVPPDRPPAPTDTTPAPTTTTPPTTTTTTTTPTTPTPPTTPPAVADTGTLRRGDQGAAVRDLQNRLRKLGYWLSDVDGAYENLTEQAVMAFQKVEGLAADGVAGPTTRAALALARRPHTSASGNVIEVDKARQVLFVVRNGAVAWALNTSTGTDEPYEVEGRSELADTPEGRWSVAWVVDGIDVGPLGGLYRPRYFHHDGIAVHGYRSVPAYPASHGCVRVTEAAMDWIWATDLMPIGSTVWVH